MHRLNLKLPDQKWEQLQEIRRGRRVIPSNTTAIQDMIQQYANMGEDFYICPKCKQVTKESDFDWKENQMYWALKSSNLCEACNRGDK